MRTCPDEPVSPAAFLLLPPLKAIHRMVVACVRCRKFANARLVLLVVTLMGRSVTIFVAIASIADENHE